MLFVEVLCNVRVQNGDADFVDVFVVSGIFGVFRSRVFEVFVKGRNDSGNGVENYRETDCAAQRRDGEGTTASLAVITKGSRRGDNLLIGMIPSARPVAGT